MAVVQDKDNKQSNDVKIGTVLGPGSKFQGELLGEGNIRIDGKYRGKIKSKGNLYIGKTGELEADIEIGSVVISGKLKGNLLVKTKAEFIAAAKFLGNINTPRISIVEGVVFEGQCVMNTRKSLKDSNDNFPQISSSSETNYTN